MKYAILESGGKQYRVSEGEAIEVDRLPLEVGEPVEWQDVLLLVEDSKISIGQPYVKGVKIKGQVVDQIKARKVLVFKYKPKIRYRRTQGHRQRYTRVMIEKISQPSKAKKATESSKASEDESAEA